MFTTKYLEELMERPLRSPVDFCSSLGLQADPCQIEFMQRFAKLPQILDVKADENFLLQKAAVLSTLWLCATVEHARGIILAPSDDVAKSYMRFFEMLITKTTDGMRSMAKMKRWNVVEFCGNREWELRLLPNNVKIVEEHAKKAIFAMVVDAGCEETRFFEARKVLEATLEGSPSMLLRLW